jgi:hypothetical protein
MSYDPEEVIRSYAENAEIEDRAEKGLSLRTAIPREYIRRYIHPSDKVLDAGGGVGMNAIMMAGLCQSVTWKSAPGRSCWERVCISCLWHKKNEMRCTPNPHIHCWTVPRYEHLVTLGDWTFKAPDFGGPYDHEDGGRCRRKFTSTLRNVYNRRCHCRRRQQTAPSAT